jgi:hypothetical protein
MESIYELTLKEKKVRKDWLLISVYSVFLAFVFSLFSALFPQNEEAAKYGFYVLLAEGIFSLIFLWIGWHCVYKKHGTKWLTCCLILGPLSIARSIPMMINHWAEASFNMVVIGIFLFLTAIYVWWYILSIQLRRINKKIQAQKKSISPQTA